MSDEQEQKYIERNARLRLEASKRVWVNDIVRQTPQTTYRVHYKDFGGDLMGYYTDTIYSIPEAKKVMEHKIASGVDVVAVIVEITTAHKIWLHRFES